MSENNTLGTAKVFFAICVIFLFIIAFAVQSMDSNNRIDIEELQSNGDIETISHQSYVRSFKESSIRNRFCICHDGRNKPWTNARIKKVTMRFVANKLQ